MITETKPPHQRRLEGRALAGSTELPLRHQDRSCSERGDEKEASEKRVNREQSVPKLDPNTRQRKGDLEW